MTQYMVLYAMLLWFLASVVMSQKTYQPNLIQDQTNDFKIVQSQSPYVYFRVQLPFNASNNYFEVTFSACTGSIRIYHSKCKMGSPGCDDSSDAWFPEASNAQDSYYYTYGHGLQPDLSFGRLSNLQQDNYVHFFGVRINQADSNGEVKAQALLRTYDSPGIAHTLISSPRVNISDAMNLAWSPLIYCAKAKQNDSNSCDVEIKISPITYTVYITNINSNKGINLGTACGLMLLGTSNTKKIQVPKENTQYLIFNQLSAGTYLLNVGGDVPDPKYSVDYAYEPIAVSYVQVTSYRPAIVLILLALIAIGIVGTAIGAYYLYKRRQAQFITLS
jgi:hypothetical protein